MNSLRVHQYLFEQALPFWADIGIDRKFGGSVEALKLDGRDRHPADFKRTRVVARQLYVFSHAKVLGWTEGADVALGLFDFLRDKCWMGADKGWARRTTLEGIVSDPTPDLYDYAFALFALGWYFKATQDAEAIKLAHQTLDLLDRDFRHPLGAFHHEIPAHPPRQQNPHMHLFEAALALFEASRDDRFMSLANEIRGYFADRMFRADLSVLPEFYEENLTPALGDRGRWIEPGHHMEWAWILAQHQSLSGTDNRDYVRGLMNFAETYGVDAATGFTVNGVRDDGLLLDGGSRTWPNTERLKGQIALQELFGHDARPAVEASVKTLFDWHLKHDIAGCWQDSFNAKGEPQSLTVPASTLYHVFLGFSEVLRVFPPPQTDAASSS